MQGKYQYLNQSLNFKYIKEEMGSKASVIENGRFGLKIAKIDKTPFPTSMGHGFHDNPMPLRIEVHRITPNAKDIEWVNNQYIFKVIRNHICEVIYMVREDLSEDKGFVQSGFTEGITHLCGGLEVQIDEERMIMWFIEPNQH